MNASTPAPPSAEKTYWRTQGPAAAIATLISGSLILTAINFRSEAKEREAELKRCDAERKEAAESHKELTAKYAQEARNKVAACENSKKAIADLPEEARILEALAEKYGDGWNQRHHITLKRDAKQVDERSFGVTLPRGGQRLVSVTYRGHEPREEDGLEQANFDLKPIDLSLVSKEGDVTRLSRVKPDESLAAFLGLKKVPDVRDPNKQIGFMVACTPHMEIALGVLDPDINNLRVVVLVRTVRFKEPKGVRFPMAVDDDCLVVEKTGKWPLRALRPIGPDVTRVPK